jgi:type III secretory pathway component EscT
MRFVKEHLIGILVGFVMYELYWRQQAGGRGGGMGRQGG